MEHEPHQAGKMDWNHPLFSGILRGMEATEQKAAGEHGWRWFCVVGIIEILAGCIALLKPVEEALTMHVTVGLVLLIQAAAFFHKAGAEFRSSRRSYL